MFILILSELILCFVSQSIKIYETEIYFRLLLFQGFSDSKAAVNYLKGSFACGYFSG